MMKILRQQSGYAHNIVIVRLDAGEELLPENELIMMADNGGKRGVQYSIPFGGVVEIEKGRKTDALYAKIKVYTD